MLNAKGDFEGVHLGFTGDLPEIHRGIPAAFLPGNTKLNAKGICRHFAGKYAANCKEDLAGFYGPPARSLHFRNPCSGGGIPANRRGGDMERGTWQVVTAGKGG